MSAKPPFLVRIYRPSVSPSAARSLADQSPVEQIGSSSYCLEVIASDATIERSSDFLALVRISCKDAHRRAATYARRLANEGPSALSRLNGRFSAVVVNLRVPSLSCTVDRFGIEQLFWQSTPGDMTVSSSPTALAKRGTARVDPQSIFNYLYFHCVPGDRTIWIGVDKVPGGHTLAWSPGSAPRLSQQWHPSSAPDAVSAEGMLELEQRAFDSLAQAVAGECASGAAAAFLSGGLDSSTVVGLAARAAPTVDAFSIGFEEARYNELEYSRLAAQTFGARHHELVVRSADMRDCFEDLLASSSQPFGNSSLVPTFLCGRLAKQAGATKLIAGDGGDEIYAGNSRYLEQMRLEGGLSWRCLGGLAPVAAIGRHASQLRRSPSPNARLYRALQARLAPLPERLEAYNLLAHRGLSSVFGRRFLEAVDPAVPLELLRKRFDSRDTGDVLDRLLYLDWKFTLQDNDLCKVTNACDAAGIDVAFPMLADEVVDVSCQVPSSAKLGPNELRAFYKRAFKSLLPDPIIQKRKHGFGLPFGSWLLEDPILRDKVSRHLESLRARSIFADGFLEACTSEVQAANAHYRGELVWVLVALECWLSKHAAEASFA